jgi:hypothetical protein
MAKAGFGPIGPPSTGGGFQLPGQGGRSASWPPSAYELIGRTALHESRRNSHAPSSDGIEASDNTIGRHRSIVYPVKEDQQPLANRSGIVTTCVYGNPRVTPMARSFAVSTLGGSSPLYNLSKSHEPRASPTSLKVAPRLER